MKKAAIAFSPQWLCELIYPGMKQIADMHGYCLSLHGSMNRDIDMLLCPWKNNASYANIVVENLRAHAGLLCGSAWYPPHEVKQFPRRKPHGRLAWAFMLGKTGVYVDLSVMPLQYVPEVGGNLCHG